MLLTTMTTQAEDITVGRLRCAGPFAVKRPAMIDTKDVNANEYNRESILEGMTDLTDALDKGKVLTDGIVPHLPGTPSVSLAGFTLTNTIYTTATVTVEGVKQYRIYVDGKQVTGGALTLQPSTHRVVVKCLNDGDTADTLTVKVDADKCVVGLMGDGAKRTYDLNDVLTQRMYTAASISPDGRYLVSGTYQQNSAGTEIRHTYLWNLATGKRQPAPSTQWMPRTSKLLTTRKNDGTPGYTLTAIDPATFAETVLCTTLPESHYTMSPTEDYVIYSVMSEGPKEAKDVYEVITPDDRQPGWRNRYNLHMYDLKTGMAQPLTFGHHNVSLCDISNDGRYLLIMKSEYDAACMRPTDFNTLYRMDLQTMQLDTLITRDGFITNALFSPDGRQAVIAGSPECLAGIGMNVSDGQTPSNFDMQLYLMDIDRRIASRTANDSYADITPLTRDFNPNVGTVRWSQSDGLIYFTAEDKDCVNLFSLNTKTGKIRRIDTAEDVTGRYTIAAKTGTMAYYGESATNPSRLYTLNLKTAKPTLIEDPCKEQYAGIDLGECHPYTWVNPTGDSICCTYYLPPHFDPSRQYPMIVNYYGGCSPTSRTFGGRYAKQAYTALGYVVLVVNPRGATGFGQKWSAMHVNTAGQYIADDIIGAVKEFTASHNFVNPKKTGCIGASYGGFMTQYLQTRTDIFAAAVSHAGISDHTSYWGEGYWGYSYSQTSMANSYPWTRRDLYIDQSPLYNADKIHTPLLFVHGTGDTNVPVGESIQMYTALKLLGRPTAMVLVEGENHWILEFQKRTKWQNTIWAWFAKWLQDDDSWWESMYKGKEL